MAGLGCLVSLVLGSLGLVLLFGLWYQSTMGREATLAQIAPTVFLLVLAAIVLIPSARVALRD